MPDKKLSDTQEFLYRWLKLFWWSRGVLAAVSLTKLIAETTSLSQFEFLKAIHALIYGWDFLSALIANWISEHIFLYWVYINEVHINLFIYFLAIVLPLIYSEIRIRRKNFINTAFVISMLLISCMAYYEISQGILDMRLNILEIVPSFSVVIFSFVYACFNLKGYFSGIFHFFIAVFTLQALYYLNSPYVAEAIAHYSCLALQGC